ncbi:hypothetical protein H5410_042130 [Solanum commersonii]|uniref:Uncharacterized protein n=1 Tax=Solanum commersonii TaxID=4109 RepID=A0A9J5XWM5_SOLCO|nr:hypothetical protein H5410_042130 [Solanum commersonii]
MERRYSLYRMAGHEETKFCCLCEFWKYYSAEQLIEFAWGLANTKMNFLWIFRSDLVMGDSAILPYEFLAEKEVY